MWPASEYLVGELDRGRRENLMREPHRACSRFDPVAAGSRFEKFGPRRSTTIGFCGGKPCDIKGAPDKSRTCDLRFRKPLLYPLSYGGERRQDATSEWFGKVAWHA